MKLFFELMDGMNRLVAEDSGEALDVLSIMIPRLQLLTQLVVDSVAMDAD